MVKLLALALALYASSAAALSGRVSLPKGAKVGVVLSGGNIDPALLASILASR